MAIADDLLEAVREGSADRTIPAGDRPEPKAVDRARIADLRARETRLTGWRRAEAAARGVDEQVVLPGHCLQQLASSTDDTVEAVARVRGIGARRAERYASTIVAVLRSSVPGAAVEGSPAPSPE
jgi:ribonuclease D